MMVLVSGQPFFSKAAPSIVNGVTILRVIQHKNKNYIVKRNALAVGIVLRLVNNTHVY